MSKIYDAIKRLEAERTGAKAANGNGNGHAANGNGNGHAANGNGNGHAANGNGNGHAANGNGNGHAANGNGNGHAANGNGNGHAANGNGNGHAANGNGNGHAANGNGNGHAANGNGNGHAANGNGNGHHANGHGANGNGHNGNGNGNGRRRTLSWLLGDSTNGAAGGHNRGSGLRIGPEVEEAYQRLGTNLLVSPGTDPARAPRLIGVVASRHGEGTTTTAAVFASIMARRRSGRVCVVEANLRSPGFETTFHIRRNGGFAELIMGTQSLAEVAQVTEVPNLYAIGCGHTHLGPSALLDAPELPAVLEQLRQQFEYVIFDLPPVNVYSDASILGPRLDAALIVIEADRTRIPEVERTRRSLDRVGVRLVGTVLNRRRNYIPSFIEEML